MQSASQGKKVYYHKIIVETNENKEFVSVKCVTMALPTYNVTRHSHSIARRDVLPPGFEEPMYVALTHTVVCVFSPYINWHIATWRSQPR